MENQPPEVSDLLKVDGKTTRKTHNKHSQTPKIPTVTQILIKIEMLELSQMPFEKVDGGSRGRGAASVSKISLRKSGSIGINNAALEEFFDEDEEHCEVYYDEDNNQVGLKGLEEESDDSFSLSRADSGASVTPMSFLRGKQLIPDITTQYIPDKEKINDSTELVVIDLDDPYQTYGSQDEDEDEE